MPYRRPKRRRVMRRRRVVRRAPRRALRRAPRRKFTVGKRKTRFGTASNLSAMLRHFSPIGFCSVKDFDHYSFYHYLTQAGAGNLTHSWLYRANDICFPVVNFGDGSITTAPPAGKHYSARGVALLAKYYQTHQVKSFTYKARLTYKLAPPPDLATSTADVHASTPPRLYMAWRISDDAPITIQDNSTSAEMFSAVVEQGMLGWRYKQLQPSSTSARTENISVTIPIRKFYKMAVNNMTNSNHFTCTTPSSATPTGWTGPLNPVYFQFVVFCVNPGENTTEFLRTFAIGYALDVKRSYTVRSYERKNAPVGRSETLASGAYAQQSKDADEYAVLDNTFGGVITATDAIDES